MKILHIHPSLNTGGVESMIFGLANQMVISHEVEVCSIFTPKHNFILWNELDPRIKKTTIGKNQSGLSLKEIYKIYQHVKEGKYDIVQTHGFFLYYILSILLCHKTTKFCYTVHSDAKKEGSRWDRKFYKLKRLFFKYNWLTPITISPTSQESFLAYYNLTSYLIPNGIPAPAIRGNKKAIVDSYKLTDRTKIILHIGRIDTPKNQLVMCKAFNRIIKEGYDVVLLIAGPIANQNIFNSLQPYLNDRIKYIGEISMAREWLAASDAMLLPSIWEGLPVTLLEAMSTKCVPLCSPVGGIPNVITDNVEGFLSKSSSEDDIYEVIKRYIDTPNTIINTIKEATLKRFTDNFGIERTSSLYIQLYKRLLSTNN